MNETDLAIWEARWKSLNQSMTDLAKQMGNSTFDRKDALHALLICLQTFAGNQYKFFRDGFDAGSAYLEPSASFPPEYVLRTTLDQVAFDLGVIQRAFNQRVPDAHNQQARNTLARADILAYKALEPAIKRGLLTNTTVVTYFQKQAAVRVIPYAPVALVAIPFSSIHEGNSELNVRDLLAIPHEVGHYVFWHGKENGDRLAGKLFTKIPAESTWFTHWLEEIFADAYGCMIAGPAIALDFQELQLDNPPQDFTRDDGEHPVPALRPYIYTGLLKAIDYNNAAEALDKLWDRHLKTRQEPKSFKAQKRSSSQNEEIELPEACRQVKVVTDKFVETLSSLHPNQRGANPVWTTNLSSPDAESAVNTIYEKFEDYLDSLFPPGAPVETNSRVPSLATINELGISKVVVEPVAGTGIQANKREIGKAGTWTDPLKDSKGSRESKIPAGVWSLIFSSNGWATAGPDTELVPKVG